MSARRLGWALAALAPLACVIAEVDYATKRCPCPAGWFCVEEQCRRAPAPPPTDASSEAASDGGGVIARPCDGVDATICEDFADDKALTSFDVQGSNGNVDIGTTDVKSPPGALVSTVRALQSGELGVAIAVRSFGGPTRRVKVDFEAKLLLGDAASLGGFATLTFDNGYGVLLVPSTDGITLVEQVPKDASAPAPRPAHPYDWTRGWTHFEVLLERVGAGVTVTLVVDGVEAIHGAPLSSEFAFGTLATLVLGFGYVPGPSAPVTAFVDDLRVTAE